MSNISQAQIADQAANIWIQMIDNPNTNYYVAIKAYDTYWQDKEKPEEEEDMINEESSSKEASKEKKKEEKEREKKLQKMSPEQRRQLDELKYQCKRFENWKREVFPFVQEDGRILTMEERLDIWKKQQEELNQQKKIDHAKKYTSNHQPIFYKPICRSPISQLERCITNKIPNKCKWSNSWYKQSQSIKIPPY